MLESSLNQERERLQYLATHDPLTKLLNRTALMDMIRDAVKAARARNESALIYLDLDNFKIINDSRGHATGDKVLARLPRSCKALSGPTTCPRELAATSLPFCCEISR